MPDPERKTISASEAAALWNVSPYVTRWMLWHKFARGANIESEDDSRKAWGRKMQPLIIEQVAHERGLEVHPNTNDSYARRGLVGCTRDAIIICPNRGPGALEIKSVFDFKTWAQTWGNGEAVPRQNEIQVQTQMFVGEESSFTWGLIAVWVCSQIYYFERRPIDPLWDDLQKEAASFFQQVESGEEPDAFGALCEAPLIAELYKLRPGEELDLSDDPDHVKTSEDVSMYQYHKELVSGNNTPAEKLRLKLLGLAKGAQLVRLPCGVNYRVAKSGRGLKIIPYVPDHPTPPPPPKINNVLAAG